MSTTPDALANNLKTRLLNLQQTFVANIDKLIRDLRSSGVDVKHLHKVTKETALMIYPFIRQMYSMTEVDKVKYFRQVMIAVNKQKAKLDKDLYIDSSRKDINAMVALYFTSMTFMFALEYSKYLTFHPTTLVASYCAPVIEEVTRIFSNSYKQTNIFVDHRSMLQPLFLNLYTGMFKYKFDKLDPIIRNFNDAYEKLYASTEIQSMAHMDQYIQNHNFIKIINMLFISILLSGFVPETIEQINHIGSLIDSILSRG
jgi:hypothetical protein